MYIWTADMCSVYNEHKLFKTCVLLVCVCVCLLMFAFHLDWILIIMNPEENIDHTEEKAY